MRRPAGRNGYQRGKMTEVVHFKHGKPDGNLQLLGVNTFSRRLCGGAVPAEYV